MLMDNRWTFSYEIPTDRWCFPLVTCFGVPLNPHPGCFGYKRKDSVHTGVDLYSIDGEPVHACEDGIVVGIEPFTGPIDNSPWWYDTDCILVESTTGVICYGEVTVSKKKVGDKVKRGEIIANIKRVILKGRERPEIPGWKPSMLHLELYHHGRTKASEGYDLSVLRDPTPFLLEAPYCPSGRWTYDKYIPGSYSKKELSNEIK